MISVDKRLQLRELKVRVEIVVTEAENAVVRAGLMVTGAQKAVAGDTVDRRGQVDGGSKVGGLSALPGITGGKGSNGFVEKCSVGSITTLTDSLEQV